MNGSSAPPRPHSGSKGGGGGVRFDPLASPDATPSSVSGGSKKHLQTYTAGEDGSRLAAAAKELGLQAQQARQPRPQVRKKRHHRRSSSSLLHHPADVWHLLLETSTEDARMRAIYSSHDRKRRAGRLPSILAGEEGEEEEEEIVDIHAEGVGGDLAAAVLGIIKGMVGPAILYLPHGFASAGFAVAVPIMMLTTVLFLYSSSCLLEAWKGQDKKANAEAVAEEAAAVSEMTALTAGDNGNNDNTTNDGKFQQQSSRRRIMLSYPELAYRALGPTGESLVKTGIALMQSGVCLTYLIFVPQNLHTAVLHLFGWNLSPSLWLIVMIALQLPLSWIRDIRKLTPTNLAANCLILYGLLVCLYFAVSESLSGPPQTQPLENLWDHWTDLTPFAKDWFLFIGTSVLLFEGSITLLVPLQEAVDEDEDRALFPTVYKRVILGIICFYAFFGITCWMAFGDEVRTVLTTSLPDGPLATTVQLAYSVAVIFTFPLQNFPALEITTRTIQAHTAAACVSSSGSSQKSYWTSRNFLSSCMVIGLAVVAVCTMNSLDKVVSLMGSLLGCPIAFVFPPLIHSQLATDLSPSRLWCNRIVAGLGVGAMVMASLTTLLTWD